MICTCDNCHYTFEDDALPTWCSNCRQENRHHKFGSKIISVPCVRPATEEEAEQYNKIAAEDRSVSELVEKLKMLGEPYFYESKRHSDEDDLADVDQTEDVEDVNPLAYPPDPYNLSVHEHNFALMLIYFTKQMGHFYGKQNLEKMIMSTEVEEKVELFKNVRKIFNRGVNDEERGIERPSQMNMEIWNAATPALKTLYAFRQDDDFKLLISDAPNRGNIKRIDLEKLASEPSDGLMRFMIELYNGMKE